MSNANSSSSTIPADRGIKIIPFIRGRIQDIKNLIYETDNISAYVKFLLLPQLIEFLGACIDDEVFNCPSQSNARFGDISSNYLSKYNRKYINYSSNSSKPSLYLDFRCAVIHQLRPSGGIKFTTRAEAKHEEHTHLVKNVDEFLILVLEDLFDDIEAVSEDIIKEIENSDQPLDKWIDPFIYLHDYD